MSAYILLDDIPDMCESCPIAREDGDCPLQINSHMMDWKEQKLDCPIREFPDERKRGYKKGYKTGYNDGWNDCLDEIIEGKEDLEVE